MSEVVSDDATFFDSQNDIYIPEIHFNSKSSFISEDSTLTVNRHLYQKTPIRAFISEDATLTVCHLNRKTAFISEGSEGSTLTVKGQP